MTDRDLLQQMIARIGKEPRAVKFDKDDNLVELNLDGLDLIELPAEVIDLVHLRGLKLQDNQLTCIPPEIGRLAHLGSLWLSRNRLERLPPEIGQLVQLRF